MRIYAFMLSENKNQVEKVNKTEKNRVGYEPKSNAKAEIIQSIYRFNISLLDGVKHYDTNELTQRMIEMFKNSKCYQAKTEEERQEIIQYLIDNPEPDNPFIDY